MQDFFHPPKEYFGGKNGMTHGNVNPGFCSTMVYQLGGYSSNSHFIYIILFYGTLPVKQPSGLLIQGWHYPRKVMAVIPKSDSIYREAAKNSVPRRSVFNGTCRTHNVRWKGDKNVRSRSVLTEDLVSVSMDRFDWENLLILNEYKWHKWRFWWDIKDI